MSARYERVLEAICLGYTGDASASARDVAPAVLELVENLLQPEERRQVHRLASLDRPFGAAAFSRRFRRFSALAQERKEAVLRRLSKSPLKRRRVTISALRKMSLFVYYAPTEAEASAPQLTRLGYRSHLASSDGGPKPIRPLQLGGDAELDCDVAIVGSGTGGAVAAAVLAEEGLDVILLEAGGYYDHADFDGREATARRRLYLDGGTAATVDRAIDLVAGSCLGGGTVVGYATSFETPAGVRREWESMGAGPFTSDTFQQSLDAISEELNVNPHNSAPSGRDRILQRGLRCLGWNVSQAARSVDGCDPQSCGYCCFGCRSSAKRTALNPWIENAFRRGVRVLIHTAVDRVIMDGSLATGVSGIYRHPEADVRHLVLVRSKAVVAACGALQTPALLMRSGLQNPNIGRHLRLHPSTHVWGKFDEEVQPWQGTMQALFSDQHADLQDGYGVRYESAPLHPGFASSLIPWRSSSLHGELMRELPRLTAVRVVLRDRDGGEVRVGRDGRPSFHYRLSQFDTENLRAGIIGAAQILAAADADEVFTTHEHWAAFRPAVGEQLDQQMVRADAAGYGPKNLVLTSVHMMCTCRMGEDEATSAADPEGRLHETENAYVFDGSALPSAPGVGPMITIAAIARRNALALASRIG